MATGLSSNQIRVGDYVSIVDGYLKRAIENIYGQVGECEVLETRYDIRLLRIQINSMHVWIPYPECVLVRSTTIKISIDDQGNFDTSDLSKDDITIIQRYINELSK